MNEWMDELRRMAGALQPTGAARGEILEGVRRARRRRAVGMTAGAVVAVAVVGVGAAVMPGVLRSNESGPATQSPTVTSTTELELFDCALQHKVSGPAPPIEGLEEQQDIVRRISSARWVGFTVRHASPTALGVVAFAQGDLETARRFLTDEGVTYVHAWDASGPEVGLDEDGKTSLATQRAMDPAMRDIRRATRGIPGWAAFAYWDEAGAVLVQWKEPVPAEVAELAGVRPDGVTVLVEGVPYSMRDIIRGMNQLHAAADDDSRIDGAFLTSTSACHDFTGIVAGVGPQSLGDRRGELQREFAQIAGMPVRVVPLPPAVAL